MMKRVKIYHPVNLSVASRVFNKFVNDSFAKHSEKSVLFSDSQLSSGLLFPLQIFFSCYKLFLRKLDLWSFFLVKLLYIYLS